MLWLAEKIDLSTLLNLLPHDSNILGTLGHLTQGTSLGTVMTLLNLLNTVHQIGGNIAAIPQDIMNALNSTLALLGIASSNLTDTLLHQVTGGKRDVLTKLY